MAKQVINVGTVANDGTGDKPRPAGIKINENFTELYGGALWLGGLITESPDLPLTVNTLFISTADFDFEGTAIFAGTWLVGPEGAASVDDFYIKP